jgi:excinuclease ABC subunit A
MVVAEGTPEQVALVPESHTGRFLKPVLEGRAPAPKKKAAPRKRAVAKR